MRPCYPTVWHAYDKRNVLTLVYYLSTDTTFDATYSVLSYWLHVSVQLSPLTDWLVGEKSMTDDSAEILFRSFSAGGPFEQFWHGQERSLFDVVHSAFPLPTTALPTLQGALKDGFREAVVACDTPEPCKFPSLDSY